MESLNFLAYIPFFRHVLIDTPGQIECFVWYFLFQLISKYTNSDRSISRSASGAIITDALASALPTIIAYIVDTPRTTSPATFMSNMLYACSILYKTKLPLVIVFNKTDVCDASFAKEWMTDFESFQDALKELDEDGNENEGGSGYMNSLMNSMSLVLEEFYKHLDIVNVSAYTGEGMDDFLKAVDQKVVEFETDYKVERENVLKQREEEKEKQKRKDLTRLMKDMGVDEGQRKQAKSSKLADSEQGQTISDIEDEGEDNDEDIYAAQFQPVEEAEGMLDPDNEEQEDTNDDI